MKPIMVAIGFSLGVLAVVFTRDHLKRSRSRNSRNSRSVPVRTATKVTRNHEWT